MVASLPPTTSHPGPPPSTWHASVWFYSFGYFAAYVPYSVLAKGMTSGHFGTTRSGLELLPVSVAASALAMFATITWLGWWPLASRKRLFSYEIPCPSRWTLLSGIATGAVVVTTTLAYTFVGVSLPLVMLLMRGGVLLLAPIVDALSGRKIGKHSWIALGLSLLSLADVLVTQRKGTFPIACVIDITVYMLAYFVRLRFMSHVAKTTDPTLLRRYFVEEQMVATPTAFAFLALLSLVPVHQGAELLKGFALFTDTSALPKLVALGVLSQATGVFGGLVLLDARENTFCVPLNRASSLLAGIVAASVLSLLFDAPSPSHAELIGAAFILGAIGVLFVGGKGRKKAG